MPNIYLLMDLSLSYSWIAAAMRANKDLLAAHGIDMAPPDSKKPNIPYWNLDFWYASATAPLTPDLKNKLEVVRTSLASGRSVLLLGQSASADEQREFFTFLKTYLHPEQHPVRPVMILGKPTLLMEAMWQITPQGVDDALANTYVDYASHFSQLVNQAQETWGKDRVTLIPDLQETISARGVAALLIEVFHALGMEETPHTVDPLPYYSFTTTATALRLLEARRIRHNDWPRLDDTAYMTTLQHLDQTWGPDPLSPLGYRQTLLEKGREDQARLETLLKLPAHSLDAPDWYGTLPELNPSAPLKPERLRAFAGALPPSVRPVLLERFANDRPLLSGDQKALAQALAREEGADFARIGDPREQPVLTVLTMAHNHERYIAQCLESVLAQKTDFPVRHLVLDHYSTDATPGIIERYSQDYPSIRPVLLDSIRFQIYQNVQELFLRCRSDYAALCDGDDYFTDPLKLQKQMDFLNAHPRCSLCFHPVSVVFEDGRPSEVFPPDSMLPRGVREEYYLADLFKGNMIQTNSVVYRWRFKDGLPDWFRHDLCPGDWYWHLLHAEQGKIGFLPDVMAVYRRHATSLYKDSSDHLKHRYKFGMAELETYHVVNEHFQDRYFLPLAGLANGILCDFLTLFTQEGDRSLLDQACDAYPKFGKHFLHTLKNLPPAAQGKTLPPTAAASRKNHV